MSFDLTMRRAHHLAGGEGVEGCQRKWVLYFAPSDAHLPDLRRRVSRVPGCRTAGACIETAELHLCLAPETDPGAALDQLHSRYFNLVLVDLRCLPGVPVRFEAQVSRALALLDAMDREPDAEVRYGFHRVVVLVSGNSDRTDRLIAQLGARHVGRILRDRGPEAPEGEVARGPTREDGRFAPLLLDELARILRGRRLGARALCCAGGGITGIYFEMGVLKCLDDCLAPARALNHFDQYYGISAGAVVAGMLANGYTIDDWMAGIAGVEGGRIPPMNLRVFRLGFLDRADIRERATRALRGLAGTVMRLPRGKARLSLDSVLLEYSDLLGPPLSSDHFEATLRALFSAPGTTNDFRRLNTQLFIGATDQDLRRHVLFGDRGCDEVPISRAIQASASVNPAFSSAHIAGRYYTDGAVTATSHVPHAIRRGADLLFVIDPFVPYVSKRPGYVRRRGLLYNIDQDLRTLSYTRYEPVRDAELRAHPAVSCYTFLPANSLRRLLSINPMDHRNFLPIWRGAYLSTLRRVLLLRHRMQGDLALHGLALDTARAEAVAERLRATDAPMLEDFYPDGRLEPRALPALPAHVEESGAHVGA